MIGIRDRPAQSSGFSLIELMVAMTLGLLLTAAAASSFGAVRASFRITRSIDRRQDDVRSLLLLVVRDVQLAGYLPDPMQQTDPTAFFAGSHLAIAGGTSSQLHAAFPFISGAVAGSDYLEVAYLGDADGTLHTCLGAAITASQLAVNVFYLSQAAGSTSFKLYCADQILDATTHAVISTGSGQALIDDLDGFNLQFGLDQNGDGTIDRYAIAADVSDWTTVASVDLFVKLMPAVGAVASAHSLTTTVAIRNRLRP